MEFKLTPDQANALALLKNIREARVKELLAIDRSMAEVAKAFCGEIHGEYTLDQRPDGYYICTPEESDSPE